MAEQASAMYAQNMANLLRHVHGKGGLDEWKIWKPGSLKQNLQKGWSFKSLISTWNAKCPIFLGNWTPKTSNYCLKDTALGFPGTHVNDQFRNTCLKGHPTNGPKGWVILHLKKNMFRWDKIYDINEPIPSMYGIFTYIFQTNNQPFM